MFLLRYLILCFLSLGLCVQVAQGQCRAESAWTQTWTSCSPTPSPNPARGEGHWLMYDLNQVYSLQDLYLWNANENQYLTQGVKSLDMDYSEDGTTWTPYGSFAVEQGSGLSYYSGTEVAEFESVKARYVLLTFTENWGDENCTRLTEVMFNLRNVALPENQTFLVYPNPTQYQLNLAVRMEVTDVTSLRLVNLVGQTVAETRQVLEPGEHTLRMGLGDLVPGLYMLVLTGENSRVIGQEKVLIKR